jgi:hypothetical protein
MLDKAFTFERRDSCLQNAYADAYAFSCAILQLIEGQWIVAIRVC